MKATKIANQHTSLLIKQKITSQSQIERKKHVELICELMLSAAAQDVIHKKSALDKIMSSNSLSDRQIQDCADATSRSIKWIQKLLPDIARTRFHKLADLYTLAVLIQRFEREGFALADSRSLRLARDLLIAFSTGVDDLSERQRKIQKITPADEIYRQYLLTVKEGTDTAPNRKQRATILYNLLASLFETKDNKRIFTEEQRRILWNTTEARRCAVASCKKILSWDDFTIDHINPHSTGGRTELDNAALMCGKHNSSKGNRRKAA